MAKINRARKMYADNIIIKRLYECSSRMTNIIQKDEKGFKFNQVLLNALRGNVEDMKENMSIDEFNMIKGKSDKLYDKIKKYDWYNESLKDSILLIDKEDEDINKIVDILCATDFKMFSIKDSERIRDGVYGTNKDEAYAICLNYSLYTAYERNNKFYSFSLPIVFILDIDNCVKHRDLMLHEIVHLLDYTHKTYYAKFGDIFNTDGSAVWRLIDYRDEKFKSYQEIIAYTITYMMVHIREKKYIKFDSINVCRRILKLMISDKFIPQRSIGASGLIPNNITKYKGRR